MSLEIAWGKRPARQARPGDRAMSDHLSELVQPFLPLPTADETERLIRLATLAWNVSRLPVRSRRAILDAARFGDDDVLLVLHLMDDAASRWPDDPRIVHDVTCAWDGDIVEIRCVTRAR